MTMFHGFNTRSFRPVKSVCALVLLALSAAACGVSDTHTAAGGDGVTPVAGADSVKAPSNKEEPPVQVGHQTRSKIEPNWEKMDFPRFTAVGKPTKTVNSPWGPLEVYDIRKDIYVKRAIKQAYDQTGVQFHEIMDMDVRPPHPLTKYPARLYLIEANMVSYRDLARLGCTSIIRPVCRGAPYPILEKPSGVEYLGQPWATKEENSKYPYKAIHSLLTPPPSNNYHYIIAGDEDKISKYVPLRGKRKIGDDVKDIIGRIDTGVCRMNQDSNLPLDKRVIIPDGRYYIGEVSGYTKEQTWDIATQYFCDSWSNNGDL